jgi:ABC-type transport system involved in multi-copper enzyme maturation permease subunit
MKRLFRIELIKLRGNASFWILASLHIGIILLVVFSSKVFLRTLTLDIKGISMLMDPSRIPLLQFPDIWHNLTYIAAYLKVILLIYVIISITGEISYNTLRQNIMNGLSRTDFIVSKLFMVIILSIGSTLLILVTGLVTGFINTPHPELSEIIRYMGFVPGYFLLLTAYLIFALCIGLWIKRTGLALGLMFLYTVIIEPIIIFNIHTPWIKGMFPLRAISNLIPMPFGKYVFREVQDYIAIKDIAIVSGYIMIFILIMYLLLRRRDL